MPNPKAYPLHPSLRNALRTLHAPLLALRLVRYLQTVLQIPESAVELMLAMAASSEPISREDCDEVLRHLCHDRVGRMLNLLRDKELIVVLVADKKTLSYELSGVANAWIKNPDMMDLSQ